MKEIDFSTLATRWSIFPVRRSDLNPSPGLFAGREPGHKAGSFTAMRSHPTPKKILTCSEQTLRRDCQRAKKQNSCQNHILPATISSEISEIQAEI